MYRRSIGKAPGKDDRESEDEGKKSQGGDSGNSPTKASSTYDVSSSKIASAANKGSSERPRARALSGSSLKTSPGKKSGTTHDRQRSQKVKTPPKAAKGKAALMSPEKSPKPSKSTKSLKSPKSTKDHTPKIVHQKSKGEHSKSSSQSTKRVSKIPTIKCRHSTPVNSEQSLTSLTQTQSSASSGSPSETGKGQPQTPEGLAHPPHRGRMSTRTPSSYLKPTIASENKSKAACSQRSEQGDANRPSPHRQKAGGGQQNVAQKASKPVQLFPGTATQHPRETGVAKRSLTPQQAAVKSPRHSQSPPQPPSSQTSRVSSGRSQDSPAYLWDTQLQYHPPPNLDTHPYNDPNYETDPDLDKSMSLPPDSGDFYNPSDSDNVSEDDLPGFKADEQGVAEGAEEGEL
ncbi:hypothetical protein ACOMHN_047572 [Nucella lapillus]